MTKDTIGRVERVVMPELSDSPLHARIDTGAKTSSISAVTKLENDGRLVVTFLGFDREVTRTFRHYTTTVVASSNGHAQERYKVLLSLVLKKRKIRAHFTLADRTTQVYPVLIGRNVLYGKFIVDVAKGTPLTEAEHARTVSLQGGEE